MKITLLADIHGNLAALEAVLRHARGQGAAQTILNLGDSVGYGPNPDAVVRLIMCSSFINILGNYDKKVLNKKKRQAGWSHVKTPEKRTMFAWTYHSLSKKARNYLKSLPETRSLRLEGVRILMSHGSPDSISEHLLPNSPEERLAELAVDYPVNVILFGHSHQSFVRTVQDVMFLNPGSVGRPDDGDPRASYAVLDLQEGSVKAKLFRVPYAINNALRAMRRTGLPEIFSQILKQGLNLDDAVKQYEGHPSNLESNGILTLLTDFGLKDHFVGVMKGVIADIAPQARVIDISHQVHPQNIEEAARMLVAAVPYFPPGTVHVAVVDPGVGTSRRAIAARIDRHFFIAPDNGLLTPFIEDALSQNQPFKLISLEEPKYWMPEISASFHGRDIFAPVGAHMANGLPMEKLGPAIQDPVMIPLSQPERTPTGWIAQVVMIDVFGNLSTNLAGAALTQDGHEITIDIMDKTIQGITRAFANVSPGTLIATIDSTGHLAISVSNGNAQERLGASFGTPVTIRINKSSHMSRN